LYEALDKRRGLAPPGQTARSDRPALRAASDSAIKPTATTPAITGRSRCPFPPYSSFRGLIEHLATLTRNQVRFAGTPVAIPMLAEPTSAQREAFELIGVSIPLSLK
jgi:hypothetical protein